jgi:hypothetical protein
MTTYLRRSYPAKKMGILEKREQELIHAIHSDYTIAKLTKAAEKVRAAKLAVLKGRRHYVVDDGHPHFDGFREIDLETADWVSKTISEIIDLYRDSPRSHRYPPPPFAST